jgi:hypothetical protein
MDQEITCPNCQAVFDVPLEYLGLQGICPDCQSLFVLEVADDVGQRSSAAASAPETPNWDEDFSPDNDSDWYDDDEQPDESFSHPLPDDGYDQDEPTWAGSAQPEGDAPQGVYRPTSESLASDEVSRRDLSSDRAASDFQFPAPQTSASRFPMAIVVGMFTGGVAAVLWAALSFATGTKQGYLMLVIALAVSRSLRSVYDNASGTARLAAGGITLASCLLGNLMIGVFIEARQKNMAVLAMLEMLQLGDMVRILQQTFSPTDLLLYLISFSMAYKGAQQDPTATSPGSVERGSGHLGARPVNT